MPNKPKVRGGIVGSGFAVNLYYKGIAYLSAERNGAEVPVRAH